MVSSVRLAVYMILCVGVLPGKSSLCAIASFIVLASAACFNAELLFDRWVPCCYRSLFFFIQISQYICCAVVQQPPPPSELADDPSSSQQPSPYSRSCPKLLSFIKRVSRFSIFSVAVVFDLRWRLCYECKMRGGGGLRRSEP
ncbi:hypothetical protein LXA43DRAFT_474070 [Ganoderma leucocontextum]|nr:hypothetical protein LXA43DRAFT_474070 [Ganoderma leucocontextum]